MGLPAVAAPATPEPHPARLELVRRRITVTEVARGYGRSFTYVSRCLLGYAPPSAGLRKYLSDLLGMPESELFHDGGTWTWEKS